jgi:hypothetical protein
MGKILKIAAALTLASIALPAWAQPFNSGSSGSYGPIDVSTGNVTLDLPANGIFHCSTVNIASGRTLTFRKNPLNTPVVLLATGDVTINGTIRLDGSSGNNVSGGAGGPGGFDGGNPGSVSVPPGAGYGPGAGRPGQNSAAPDGAGGGSYATVSTASSTNKGAVYGSALLVPIVGGSGGGGYVGTPGAGGGGGGGALLIASNTRINLIGSIGASGGGSSGSAQNAPVITGNGSLFVSASSGGGAGRIRIDTLDRSGINFGFNPGGITSIGSMMIVFPEPLPRLNITEAAGTAIPVGSGPVFVNLPFGSNPNRIIKVQAQDFNDSVPVRLVLTPDNGSPLMYDAVINNLGVNPAETSVSVVLPINVQTSVHAFTR